jgi:patatin-related protein
LSESATGAENADVEPAGVPDGEREEIRLALVMTGGVSLAVWMGGVATEINRLVGSNGPYRDLLDLTRSSVRVDVIGGTSAGGVNGAFLAMALAHGTDMSRMRSAWLELGALADLIRSPDEESPPSLLQGDGYFLPSLRRIFTELGDGPATDPSEIPVHLVLTSTLLRGERRSFQDDFGGRIQDMTHRATFTFRRGNESDRDDFSSEGAVDRLALAARATASFPGAFEPAFAALGDSADATVPDMSDHADFAASGFLIDGGVLMNKPIRPVLRAVYTRQNEGQGRRVLVYVVPDSNLPVAHRADPPGIPRMAKVVGDSMQIPRVESVAEDLESIRTHNQQVRAQRRLRWSLLGTDPQFELDPVEALASTTAARTHAVEPVDLAAQLFPAYLGARREYTGRLILDQLARGLHHPRATAEEDPSGRRRTWDRSRVREALRTALTPELPTAFPSDPLVSRWPWDISGVETAATTTTHLLTLGLELAPHDGSGGVRAELLTGLSRVQEVQRTLRRLLRGELRYWRVEGAASLMKALAATPKGPEVDEAMHRWMAASLAQTPSRGSAEELSGLAASLSAVLVAAAGPLRTISDSRRGGRAADDAVAATLAAMLGRLGDGSLQQLLAVVVVQSALAGGEPVVEQIVELLQISAEAPNGFDDRRSGREKLAGLQLGHFGAFYKRSWRANDWMWGRMDAVDSLVRIVLNPGRLRRLAAIEPSFTAEFMESLRRACLPPDDPAAEAVLAPGWDGAAVERELAFLDDPALPLPASMPAARAALTRRIQLGIVQEELPHIAVSIGYDVKQGAVERHEARAFAEAVRAAQHQSGGGKADEAAPLAPADAARLLGECHVGRERIADESSSPLYLKTVNAAAAVGLRAAQRHASEARTTTGPKKRPLRHSWPAYSPMVGGITGKSVRLFVVTIAFLVAGAGLLAFALSPNGPRPNTVVEGSLFLTIGLALAVVRTRSGRRIALASLAILAGLLLVLSFFLPADTFLGGGAFRVETVVAVAVAGAAFGGLPPSLRPRARARRRA